VVMLAHLETSRAQTDRRRSQRHILKLRAPGATLSDRAAVVLVHDLSLTGFLMETSADLSDGADLQIELPEAGMREARVVWNSGRYFGCEFHAPISKGGLSAALLKSPTNPNPFDGTYDEFSDQEEKYSPRTRLLIMTTLALAAWAVVLLVFALI
jgi:hypothetical protein